MTSNDSATNGFLDNLRNRESCADLMRVAESPEAENYDEGWNVVDKARASAEARKRLPASQQPSTVRFSFPEDEWKQLKKAAAMVGMTPGEFLAVSADLACLRLKIQGVDLGSGGQEPPADPQADPLAE